MMSKGAWKAVPIGTRCKWSQMTRWGIKKNEGVIRVAAYVDKDGNDYTSKDYHAKWPFELEGSPLQKKLSLLAYKTKLNYARVELRPFDPKLHELRMLSSNTGFVLTCESSPLCCHLLVRIDETWELYARLCTMTEMLPHMLSQVYPTTELNIRFAACINTLVALRGVNATSLHGKFAQKTLYKTANQQKEGRSAIHNEVTIRISETGPEKGINTQYRAINNHMTVSAILLLNHNVSFSKIYGESESEQSEALIRTVLGSSRYTKFTDDFLISTGTERFVDTISADPAAGNLNLYAQLTDRCVDIGDYGESSTASFLGTATHVVFTNFLEQKDGWKDRVRGFPEIAILTAKCALDYLDEKLKGSGLKREPQHRTKDLIQTGVIPWVRTGEHKYLPFRPDGVYRVVDEHKKVQVCSFELKTVWSAKGADSVTRPVKRKHLFQCLVQALAVKADYAHLLMAVIPYNKQVTHIKYDFISVKMTNTITLSVINGLFPMIDLNGFERFNKNKFKADLWDNKMELDRIDADNEGCFKMFNDSGDRALLLALKKTLPIDFFEFGDMDRDHDATERARPGEGWMRIEALKHELKAKGVTTRADYQQFADEHANVPFNPASMGTSYIALLGYEWDEAVKKAATRSSARSTVQKTPSVLSYEQIKTVCRLAKAEI